MVTGASTADLALILIDARNGRARAVPPARLHRQPAGHPPPGRVHQQDGPGRLVAGALRGDPRRVPQLRHEARGARPDVHPVSALHGDNIVQPQRQHALVRGAAAPAPPRAGAHRLGPQPDRRPLPVQYVIRPQRGTDHDLHDYRGYAGTVAGGIFKPGDEVVVLPSGFTSHGGRGPRPRRRSADRGVPAAVGHPAPRRRPRHRPGRHDLPARTTGHSSARTSTPWCAGSPTSRR